VTDQLNRRLGLVPLLAMSVGAIIGSAWLFAPLFAAQMAGPGAIVSWLISGGVALLLALVYAELGAAFPVAGGLARFSYFSHGNLTGFVAGASCWLGYAAIRDRELQPYQGRSLALRTLICAAVYVALWVARGYLPAEIEMWEWLYYAPVFVAVGAFAAFACFDFETGAAIAHFSLFLMVTAALRWLAGITSL
jgi:amino acid permease